MSILADYLTRDELAAELNCCPRTVDRLRMRPDGIPYTQLGGKILFRRESVAAWIAAQERRPNPRRKAA